MACRPTFLSPLSPHPWKPGPDTRCAGWPRRLIHVKLFNHGFRPATGGYGHPAQYHQGASDPRCEGSCRRLILFQYHTPCEMPAACRGIPQTRRRHLAEAHEADDQQHEAGTFLGIQNQHFD
eukprot:16433550-Heterocapsa_arctica.AAC.7